MALSTQDFTKGLDLTAQAAATASQVNQMFEAGTPYSDKGQIGVTTDSALDTPVVPNAAVTTKWQRYLWLRLRLGGLSPLVYNWNPNATSHATMLKWELLTTSDVISFATIALLRAHDSTSLTNGKEAMVKAYYSDYSGYFTSIDTRGGGFFIWRATATDDDDGGRWIKPTDVDAGDAGRWERILSNGDVNVKMWGARGDNTTDDTAAIQAALDALSLVTSGTLVFPSGQYRISDTLFLPQAITIQGEGSNPNVGTLITNVNNTLEVIFESKTSAQIDVGGIYEAGGNIYNQEGTLIDYEHGFCIRDIAIINAEANATTVDIRIGVPGECSIIENVLMNWGAVGIHILSGGAPCITIRNCRLCFMRTAGAKFSGIDLASSELGLTRWGDTGSRIIMDGVSGDVNQGSVFAPTAAFVLFDNTAFNLAVNDIKIEGSYPYGVFAINWPALSSQSDYGIVSLRGGSVLGDFSVANISLFKLTQGTALGRGPNIAIHAVQIYGYANLIEDVTNDYTIKCEGSLGGPNHFECISPLYYQTNLGAPCITKVSRSETVFVADTIGWYRIFKLGQSNHLAGTFRISSTDDSSSFRVSAQVYEQGRYDCTMKLLDGIKLASHPDHKPVVTKARAGLLMIDNTQYTFVDIYVAKVLALDALTNRIFVSFEREAISKKSTVELVPPMLVDDSTDALTFDVDAGTAEANGLKTFAEIELADNNTNLGSGDALGGHLRLGNNHLFYGNTFKELRQYSREVEVVLVPVGGAPGTAAVVKAHLQPVSRNDLSQGFKIDYCTILNPGAGYAAAPLVYFVPVNGTSPTTVATATATITGGIVHEITMVDKGAGYAIMPTDTSGNKVLVEVENGTGIKNSRLINPTGQIALTLTNGSLVVTGVALKDNLFKGDYLRDTLSDAAYYYVTEVLSNTTAILSAAVTGATGGRALDKVGMELFPAQSGRRYVINDTFGFNLGATAWAGCKIRIRSKGGVPQTIAEIPTGQLGGAAAKATSTITQAVAGVGGTGGFLTAGYGVELVLIDGAGDIKLGTAGSLARIMAEGIITNSSANY